MAVTLVDTGAAEGRTAVGGITVSFANTASVNAALVVAIAASDTTAGDTVVNTVTFNGDSLSRLAEEQASAFDNCELWGMVAPDVTTGNIVVDMGGTVTSEFMIAAASFNGVNQSTPFLDATAANSGSGNPSLTVPNVTADDYVVDAGYFSSDVDNTAGADQSEVADRPDGVRGSMSVQPGTAGGVMSWTLGEAGGWVQCGIRVVSASVGFTVVGRSVLDYSDD